MPSEGKKPERITGRTPWDFAADVAERFGLGILILAGIVYAFYKFQEQAREFEQARQEATASVQQRLNEAHGQLRDTYVAIGDMNKKVVDNIRSGFDTLQELQSRLKGLQEQASAEAKKAEDAIALQKQAEGARLKAVDDLANAKLEHERIQKLRVAKSGPFKDKVRSLISLLSDESLGDTSIAELAEEIRQEYIVDPCEILQRIADDPNAKDLESLGQELEGLKLSVLKQIAQENKAGFATWMLLYAEHAILCGFVQISQHEAIGVVFIEADKERVFSAEVASRALWLIFPSVHDWDRCSVIGIVEPQDPNEANDFGNEGKLSFPVGQKPVPDLLRLVTSPNAYDVDILVPTDATLQPITLDDLSRKYPLLYEEIVADPDFVPVAAMLRKARTFNAADIVPISLGQSYGDLGNLRAAIVQVLNAAVSRNAKRRQDLAGESFHEWGPLAAWALYPEFAVSELEVSSDRLEASIMCSFRDSATGDIPRARANFTRAQPLTEGQWYIRGFRKLPPEPRQSALQKAY